MYMPTPQHIKWMDDMIAGMAIKPDDLSARLKRAFRIEPAGGIELLKALIAETRGPVEQHVPSFDTAPYRANSTRRRPVWDAPPAGLGLPSDRHSEGAGV